MLREKDEVKFGSASMEVKYLILECLSDGKQRRRKEIVAHIKENYSNQEELTDGIIAGGFKMLTDSSEIEALDRGVYQKGPGSPTDSFQDKVIFAYGRFKKELNRLCTRNLLNVSDDDWGFIRMVSEVTDIISGKILAGREEIIFDTKPERMPEQPETVTDNSRMPEPIETAETGGGKMPDSKIKKEAGADPKKKPAGKGKKNIDKEEGAV